MSPKKFRCECGEAFDTAAEWERHFMTVGEVEGHERIEPFDSAKLSRPDLIGSPEHQAEIASGAEHCLSKGAPHPPQLPELYERFPTIGLSFLRKLREVSVARAPRFGHGVPDEWLVLDDGERAGVWGPMQWGCALAGEAGELCNKLKKYERQLPTDPRADVLIGEIAEEVADVLIYLDLIASIFMLDMEAVTRAKFNKVSKSLGFPERL